MYFLGSLSIFTFHGSLTAGERCWGSLGPSVVVQRKSNMEDEEEKDSDSKLLLLADELIDMVLSYPFIDHKDLCRCAQVCRRLNIIATGNELWKKKSLSR